MKNLLLPVIFIFFCSCQQKENKNTSTKHSGSSVLNKNKDETKQIEDTLFMNFSNAKGPFIAEGSLDSIHHRFYVKFKNEEWNHLKATIITPTGKGNIRFNQIIFPDKTSDGPYGMDLEMKLIQKGNYILVIGHSLMADNPFYGTFKIEIETKKE